MIEKVCTSMSTEEKPESQEVDYNNNKFTIGALVAYNRSGQVRLGTIEKFLKNEWKATRKGVGNEMWYSLKFQVMIKDKLEGRTIVRNPNSLVIIN